MTFKVKDNNYILKLGDNIMEKLKLALIGAGPRGFLSYGPYAAKHPNEVEFVAVAEPDDFSACFK